MIWFNSETKRLRSQLESQQREINDLTARLAKLESYCSMRVGDLHTLYAGYGGYDPRPVLTAMDAVRQLMDMQGVEPVGVREQPAMVVLKPRASED